MYKLFVIIFHGLALITIASSSHHYFYRRDYSYIEEFDAFYKFHWDPEVRSWTDAFKACDDEGAKLFYPKDNLEWKIVKNLTESINTTEVTVGIRDQYGFGEFTTVDGQPVPIPINGKVGSEPRCVYMEIDTGSYNVDSCAGSKSRPFVCKKVDETPCPTIDLDYVYNKEVKKCYKVHNRAKNWQDAYHTCYQEGAMLAVVENESEAHQLHDILAPEPTDLFHVGYSRIGNDYFTITGKRFEKFYQKWYQEEQQTSHQCGAVWPYNSALFTKTVPCNDILPFVCEMNAYIFV